MEDKKFITQEEMDEIKSINQDYEKASKDLGAMELHRIALDTQRKGIESWINQIREKEFELGKKLNEKYGEVNIHPVTGEIVPIDAKQ